MTVHSKDRETWLTKLERIKLLASQNQEMKFNNIGHIIDLEMLAEQYEEQSSKKAVGTDGITKEEYGKKLKANLSLLLIRIRRSQYNSKPARTTMIPKEDGGKRPLVISCFEDKLVESAVSKILNCIFEPIFLKYSFGNSGMLSTVVANKEENIKFVLIEPVSNGETSQIEAFLNYNKGAGVQHLAFLCKDIINSVRLLKQQGLNFLDVPVDYYIELKQNIKHKLNNDLIQSLMEHKVLIDEDQNGYLMQVFSKPIQSIPTFFIELIQREKATGFGSRNIKALYAAVQKSQKSSQLFNNA